MTNQSINSLLRKEFTNSLLDKLDKIAAWNVEELLLDRRFGDFHFQDCVEIFQRAKTWAIDLKKYGASDSGDFFRPERSLNFLERLMKVLKILRNSSRHPKPIKERISRG